MSDAIHNLRSPLDILWRQVWTKGKSEARKQYFPILDSAQELKARFKGVKQPAQKAVVEILRAIIPYHAGNKLLWALHEIDTRDKHEVPVLAAAAYKKFLIKLPPDVSIQGRSNVQIASEIGGGFLFLEDGTELPLVLTLESDRGPVMPMECEVTADIAFAQGEILEGQPVLETLHESAQLVDRICEAFLASGLIASIGGVIVMAHFGCTKYIGAQERS